MLKRKKCMNLSLVFVKFKVIMILLTDKNKYKNPRYITMAIDRKKSNMAGFIL